MAELVRAETLAKILHPKGRIRFVRINRLHLDGVGFALIKEFLMHGVDDGLDALAHANLDIDGSGCIVLLELADLRFGLLIALAIEDIGETGQTVAQFFGSINSVGLK